MKYFLGMALATTAMLSSTQAAFAEQYLSTSCSSTGQSCNSTVGFSLNSDGPGADYALKLTAPATHCSAVSYVVTSASGARTTTPQIFAGQSVYIPLGNLAKGSHAFIIGAIGHTGGCNAGQLQSWGVNAQGTVIPR